MNDLVILFVSMKLFVVIELVIEQHRLFEIQFYQ